MKVLQDAYATVVWERSSTATGWWNFTRAFQGNGVPGKIQFGSGWRFLDQEDGMIRQMTALANLGLLSRFVGMLTDSHSFLSYTRHEYFRRILCNYLGNGMMAGRIPSDYKLVGEIVCDICFNNTARYFDFGLA